MSSDDRACGLQLLLEHGSDSNLQNEWGNLLLCHQLVRHANERPLRHVHLAESGLLISIDPSVVNKDGLTPLDLSPLLPNPTSSCLNALGCAGMPHLRIAAHTSSPMHLTLTTAETQRLRLRVKCGNNNERDR